MTAPTDLPIWATTAATGMLVAPDLSKQQQGWSTDTNTPTGNPDHPPLQYFNWWMNLVYQWINYMSVPIADLGTMAYQNANAVAITGGTAQLQYNPGSGAPALWIRGDPTTGIAVIPFDGSGFGEQYYQVGHITANSFGLSVAQGTYVGNGLFINSEGVATANQGIFDAGVAPTLPDQLTNKAYVDSVITTIPSGFGGPFWGTVADVSSDAPGWIPWLDGTIGNAGSGSSIRANADTVTIFTRLWAAANDTTCPIFTSSGSASTRGGSAAADFAANKRISTPRANGCVIGISGPGINSRGVITSDSAFAETYGEENHSLTANENGPHAHGMVGGDNFNRLDTYGVNGSGPEPSRNTADSGLGTPHNTIQPTTWVNWIIKL